MTSMVTKTERHKAVPAVYVFLVRDGKLLLTRRKNTGYEDGNYMVPSGHVEKGESLREAMAREAMEEVGVALKKDNLHFAHVMYRAAHDETGERADFFFTAEHWEGEPRNMEPEKCDEVAWFPFSNLPANTVRYLKSAVQKWIAGESLSEWEW